MAHIDYISLSIRNFNSIQEIDFPIQPGKHLVIGENRSSGSSTSNGSGKSSIFESLLWTQYKRSIRDKDPSRNYEGSCVTSVKFLRGTDEYCATRHYKDKEKGSTLNLLVNGETVTHRKAGSTEEELRGLIGVNSDIFMSTTLVLQGLPINFSQMTPTILKQMIEEMLGFQIWEQFKDKFSFRSKDLKNLITSVNMEFNDKNSKMISTNSRLETLKDVEASNTNVIQGRINEFNFDLEKIIPKIKDMKIRIGSLLDQETINNKYTALGDIVKFSSFTESKINNLKSVFETMLCPTCTQPYPEVKIKSAREEYDILSGKLSRLRESENGLRIIIEKYQVVERELSLLMKDYEHKDNEIKSLQDKLKTPSIDLEEIKSDLDILVMEVNLIQERINEVSLNMSNSEYIHDLLLPSSQFRTKVLERYLSFINSLISSITPLLYGEVSIKLEVDPKGHGVFLQIMKGTTEYNYKSLSGGEKRRVDIIIILAMQRFLIESSGFSSNLLVFDEIFDNLDKMGVQNVLSCIDTLFPESSCIYIITHNDSIKSLFNSVVRVVKEDDISRIEAHEVINE